MTAYLVVRAIVPPELSGAFSDWYATQHIPEARRAFRGVESVERWVGRSDPTTHLTVYRFSAMSALEAGLASEEMKGLIEEFDRLWGHAVVRTREHFECVFRQPDLGS